MFVQGRNTNIFGENSNLEGKSIAEALPNPDGSSFCGKAIIQCDNEVKKCMANKGIAVKVNESNENICNVLQSEEVSKGTFLVQDALENSDFNVSKQLQVDRITMVDGDPSSRVAGDAQIVLGNELSQAGKSTEMQNVGVTELSTGLGKVDPADNSNELNGTDLAQAIQVLPCLNDSSFIMVQTEDGEQVYTVNMSQLFQAVPSDENIPLDKSGEVVFNLLSSTDDGLAQMGIVTDNQTKYVVETLASVKSIQEPNKDEKVSPKKLPNQAFKCSEQNCDKSFSNKKKLKAHSAVHEQQPVFKCTVESCEWSFKNNYKLLRHLETHLGEKNFMCDVEGCGRAFTTVYNLKAHQKIHNQPLVVPCEVCGEKFPSTRKMEIHFRQHENVDAQHECHVQNCGRKFLTSYALSSHMKRHQIPESELKCTFEGCGGKVFENMSRLRQHIRQHTGERPYVCDFEGCTWAFTTGSKLARHKRKHTGVRKYSCPFNDCDKKFMRKEHCDQHVISHSHAKPFVCEYKGCNSRFAAKASWYVHRRKVHLSKPQTNTPVYMCLVNDCQKEFTNKAEMKLHFQEHCEGLNVNNISVDSGVFALISGDEASEAGFENSVVSSSENGTELNGAIVTVSDSKSTEKDSSSGPTLHIIPIVCDPEITQAVNTINKSHTSSVDNSSAQKDLALNSSEVKSAKGRAKSGKSGCARTDFLYTLSSNRRKNRRAAASLAEIDKSLKPEEEASSNRKRSLSEVDKSCIPLDMNLAPTDVVLTSGAITFRDPATGAHFVQTQLLQDDPPSVIADIQSDQLLSNLCSSSQLLQSSESTIPASLFTDNTVDSPNKNQTSHFFAGMTFSMQDFPNDACLQNGDC